MVTGTKDKTCSPGTSGRFCYTGTDRSKFSCTGTEVKSVVGECQMFKKWIII